MKGMGGVAVSPVREYCTKSVWFKLILNNELELL